MNKVDIYINGFRLDLFDDEEITINLSVQNVQDISKVFTDFTQGFTVPASAWNNAIFQHYYRSDIDSSTLTKKTLLNGESLFLDYKFRVLKDGGVVEAGGCCADALDALGGSLTSTTTAVSFDGRLRQAARIEINSLPFRTGVIEVENVQLKGTEPYAYTITFYGDVVTLTDLFGDDYLYDIDFSAYNIDYTDGNILTGLTTEAFEPLFFPLMSPVQNWFYNSSNSSHEENNIAYHTTNDAHSIRYYELKPALKVTAVLDAIEAQYGITFTGSFIASAPFTDLALWLHRREGYMYDNQPAATAWELIDFDETNSPTPDWFSLDTETWTPVGLSGTGDVYSVSINVSPSSYTDDYFVGVFRNGVLVAEGVGNGNDTIVLSGISVTNNIESLQVKIRPSTNVPMSYQVASMTITNSSLVVSADVYMSTIASYALAVIYVQDLMPEIKVKDFLGGILKMYNMVIQPTSATSFLLQPLDDWYAAGTDQDYQTYFDITEYTVNRPSLYREIEFKYQETEQILGAEYRNTNNTGFGDLRAFFTFDGDEFVVETPFECPLFERLTDENGGALTDVLVYKSITNEIADDGVSFKPYLGAPILFYAQYGLDLTATPVNFTYADGAEVVNTSVTTCWYANTSNNFTSATLSDSICFGADIDPYHLTSVSKSLYYNYWSEYITDLYNKGRRLIQIDAVLPVGKMITMNLKNAVIWNNAKYIVNNVQLNMTTGKATFELLNVV
jgi:hypothetical protein